MTLARRRPVAVAAFALLALLAEVVGRSATLRVDRALSVRPLATTTTAYYPFLLAGVKLAATLAAGALALRLVRAHTTAAAAERLLATIGPRPGVRPRLRVRLSPRLWLAAFTTTALWYLLETSADQMIDQRRPLLAAWLHTYALPVFVVLSLLVALVWAAVSDWLSDVEGYTTQTLARAKRVLGRVASLPRPRPDDDDRTPRHLFGVVFESRPPPLLSFSR